jgi:hypothetical protein
MGNLISYDGFDYPVSTGVPGTNGGTGWAAGWQANGADVGEIVSGSIAFGDAGFDSQSTGNRLSWTNGANGDGWSRQLASSTGSSDTTFVSFLYEYDRTAAGDSFVFGVDTQIRNPRSYAQNRIFFGRNGVDTTQTVLTAISGGTSTELGTFNVDSTNPVMVVLGIDAAGDAIDIWLNPGSLGGSSPSVTATATGMGLGSFNWLNWAGSWNNWKLDEVRVGTSYGDVTAVPEPATYAALFGVLALAGVMWRRRR